MRGSEDHLVFRLLARLGLVLGVIASLLTILSYFSETPVREYINIEALRNIWDLILPQVTAFREWWPIGPAWSAVIVYLIVASISWWVEEEGDWYLDETGPYIGLLIILMPLPATWFILHHAQTSWIWLAFLGVGYIAMPWISLSLIPELLSKIENKFFAHNEKDKTIRIIGVIRKIEKTESKMLGYNGAKYELIVDHDDSEIVFKVYYEVWDSKGKQISPLKSGAKVEIEGHWNELIFNASKITTVRKKNFTTKDTNK